MTFLVQEKIIECLDVLKEGFEVEASTEVKSRGGRYLVCGVEAGNESVLPSVMEMLSMGPMEELLGSLETTEAQQGVGVPGETIEESF